MYISSDTNIWLDFQIVGALELPFKLSHKFHLSEETINDELLTPPEIDRKLVDYGLIVLQLTEEEYYFAFDIAQKYLQISRYDALALSIAKKRNFILLTGDKRLRMVAANEGVEVHGTIWIFDELLREHLINEEAYVAYMQDLQHHNGKRIRLPADEIQMRINRRRFQSEKE